MKKTIRHIVIVDRDVDAARQTMEVLESYKLPARFSLAETLIEVSRIYDKDDIDLIVLELNLEGSRGFKTMRALCDRIPDVPLIVYTEVENEVIISQALRAGALEYLVKDSTPAKQLARAVRNAEIRYRPIAQLAALRQDLELAQAKNRETQRIALTGDWTMDIVDGAVTWSDMMYEIFDPPAGKAISDRMEFEELIYPPDLEDFRTLIREVTNSGLLQEAQIRIPAKPSGFKYIKIRAQLKMFDAIGGMAIVGTCQDITQEVHNQSSLIAHRLSGHTRKVQRKMLTHLGFNIRTQMSTLVNLFYLLESGKEEDRKKLLPGIKTSFESLNEHLHRFLNSSVALVEELKPAPVESDIRGFLQVFRNFMNAREGCSISIDIKNPEKLARRILIDEDKLQQILLNITHAFNEATGADERDIHIKLSCINPRNGNIELKFGVWFDGFFPFGQEATIFSSPEAYLSQAISEEDASVPDMDLAIAARLIQALGGAVKFESSPVKTNISFSIPAAFVQEEDAVDISKPVYPLKILLVEDHILNQMATKKILEKWGAVTVDIADNGKKALQAVSKKAYDIVLMDLQMPVLDGLAATRIIRKTSAVPIIALTAHASDNEKEKCLEAGMNDYLSKPFKPKSLYKAINLTLRRAAGSRNPANS